MKSGMPKPPLAPKPKLNQPQRSELSPLTPRRDGLPAHASPGTPHRVKPALAPKPCLSKLSAAAAPESNSVSPKSLHHQFTFVVEKSDIPKNVGLQNSKNGLQQENKKPDWDYIIPICLCTHENCQCMGNATDKMSGKSEKDLKKWHKSKTEECGKSFSRSQVRVDNRGERMDGGVSQVTNGNLLTDHAYCRNNNSVPDTPVQNKRIENKNLKSHADAASPVATVRPSLPLRSWSDEANGNVLPSISVGPGPEEGSIGSSRASASSHASPTSFPTGPKKTRPVPSPRMPRKAALGLARQEKAEDEDERGGGEMSAREVKVSLERKSSPSSLSVNVHVPAQSTAVGKNELSSRKACPPPAPPPKKKLFLSTPAPERRPSSAPCSPSRDAKEENLGWNDGVYEMECSVDGEDIWQAVRVEGRTDDRQAFYGDVAHFPPSSGPQNQPELSRHPATALGIGDGSSEGNGAVRIVPKKPQRHSAHMVLEKDPSGDISPDIEKRPDLTVQDGAPRATRIRELPLLPEKTTKRSLLPTLVSPGHCKAPRSVRGKQRAKSFSSADLIRTEGQKKNSLRRLLDLKLSVKMLPKLKAKGGQTPECATAETEQCVDGDASPWAVRKLSCPQIGFEQNVDGDEFYENSPHYEEIPDYMNLGGQRGQNPTYYDDENIYEEQEPYMLSPQKHTEHQQKHSGSDRGYVDEEEVAVEHQLHDVSWGDDDDDIMAHSSDEEDDGSSTSSKGDPAHQEEEQRENESGPKKSKIHHIATEIMSSEHVFVDVLKLLHIDFREAVAKASRQSGKPVIEERVLNQILYSLPQLYELNQDLLRELEQRVAKWDESSRLADIFVKKGPYLKMYSTYIREFDKNVTQLEEQKKRNSVFAGVLREFEASPRCANLALKDYLLKPIQRIPQYRMLLTDYLKNLPPDSVDFKDTQAALGIVIEVANHANDIMKQGDNGQKLIQVQCRLNGHQEIVQPGRVFLKEGVLMKLSRKVMQPRMFFLFNDTLLYTTPVQSGQYKLNNMLSLAGMKVSKPNQELKNELNIESVERSFILSASSATERDEWLDAISMAINDYTRKKITFISGKAPEEMEPSDGASLGSKAPIWIPDLRTTMCMICICDFTLTWRRHHCRACGKVVCQACSSNKYGLEYLKNQLARVCDQCFTVLQQNNEQAQAMALSPPGSKSAFAFPRKQKKIAAALKEVTANTDNSSMSGYLQNHLRSKGNKRQVKRLWFVIKDKVLYTYAASEDVAALESQPLLGLMLKEDSSQKLQFKLYHKNTLYYIFKADDIQTAQRWIDSFKEAAVL